MAIGRITHSLILSLFLPPSGDLSAIDITFSQKTGVKQFFPCFFSLSEVTRHPISLLTDLGRRSFVVIMNNGLICALVADSKQRNLINKDSKSKIYVGADSLHSRLLFRSYAMKQKKNTVTIFLFQDSSLQGFGCQSDSYSFYSWCIADCCQKSGLWRFIRNNLRRTSSKRFCVSWHWERHKNIETNGVGNKLKWCMMMTMNESRN